MSELPRGWAATTYGEIAEVQLGKMLDKAKNRGEDTPYLRNVNVRWGEFDLTDVSTMKMSSEERAAFSLQDGDILVCEGGEPGRSAVWKGGSTDLTFQKAIMRIRCPRGVEPSFLQLGLRHASDIGELVGHFTGTTIRHLPQNVLRNLPVRLAPSAEQRRIVAKLDALTARTARARADLGRIPALAARYKQAVLAKAFSGELTAEWRASNHQSARSAPEQDQARRLAWASLPKRRGKYESAEVADWNPDLELPETWRWASVDELTSMVQYGSSAKTSDDVAVPVLRMGNIVDGALDLGKLKYLPADHEEFPDLLLDNGDLLFNRTNSPELVGKTAVFRGASGSTSFASYLIRLKPVDYHPELLAAYVNSSFGRTWVATATSQQVGQANVNGTKLRALGVPLMPPSEQLVVWERIKSAFIEIDRLKAEAATARRLLDRLDRAVLAEAFRGELVPQDPADEPADVLLDRIRAEREAAPKAKRGRKPKVAA